MLRFINELIYICVITIFLNMYSELHFALVFFLFGSMIAALKFDMRDEEHSYLYKAYRQHLRNRKEI
ncbi:hypothetical protein [Staphylococcus hominis]|uniref:hypothetical protein n=1 Tax=Staphylococcus hominis TaxID=1290 RepID=UPI001C3D5905|nr:hypothetical protein [Staphylococcus hominis]MBV5220529.1 hypothetical protein [Staphylococcus hominis]WRY66250.1 hypothetical protein P8632_02660 [Staphylococcus hominis]